MTSSAARTTSGPSAFARAASASSVEGSAKMMSKPIDLRAGLPQASRPAAREVRATRASAGRSRANEGSSMATTIAPGSPVAAGRWSNRYRRSAPRRAGSPAGRKAAATGPPPTWRRRGAARSSRAPFRVAVRPCPRLETRLHGRGDRPRRARNSGRDLIFCIEHVKNRQAHQTGGDRAFPT